jgi:uroporphyrin-III C-methyltransferase
MSDRRDDTRDPAADAARPSEPEPGAFDTDDQSPEMRSAGGIAALDGDTSAPAPPPPRHGRTLTLAVLLSLTALAIAGFSWWQSQVLEQRLGRAQSTALAELAAADARRIDQLDAAVAELRERDESQQVALSRLRESSEQALAGLRAEMAQWPLRLGDIEDSIAGLRGVSDDTRGRWLQAEAEYFLNIANAELQLVADIARAMQALELADARLRQIDEPGLNDVRAAIAVELGALREVPSVDRAGISLRLAALAQRVDSLPLPQPAPGRFDAGGPARPEAAAPGFERAWATLRQALSNMVSVRRDASPVVPQLAPQEAFVLRRNLELQIENARLAMLQREPALFRDHLQSAIGWLEAWFDVTDPGVAGFHETLAELAALDIAPPLPRIDESLRRLRDHARNRPQAP